MVAGICQRCGVDIGASLPRNLEDQSFVGKEVSEMLATIGERNEKLQIWGWKYPRAATYLSALEPHLRNPRYIVVWRDLLAIAARGIRNSTNATRSLRIAHSIQGQNIDFTASTSAPVLHVSYEKAIRAPVALVAEIQAFTGANAAIDSNELLAFAQPGRYK